MRVLNIIFDSRLGGPQWRIAEVAKELKKHHIDTFVLLPKNNAEGFVSLLNQYKINFLIINVKKLTKKYLGILKWLIYFIPQVFSLVKIIREINPDIVHCNASWQWKGVIAAKLAGKKVVWHLNDTKMPFFIKIVFRFLVKKADGVIVEGKRVKDYYLKNFNIDKPIVEIQAPVDADRFNPNRVAPDKKLSKYKGIKILSVGNVNPYKGFEYLIDAANLLNKKYDNLWFFVAGNLYDTQKKYIEFLKRKIKECNMKNFIFLGGVENIESVLKASDIYVCSSIAEASPQSVWEAMAMEKPVVSTDVGSVAEFIKDGENGFIVPIKSPDMLAEKIDVLINDKNLRKEFGKRLREVAIKELDIKICAEKHKEIYERIIKNVDD